MHKSLLLSLLGLTGLALYTLISWVVTGRRNAEKARRLGCQDAPQYPARGFLGSKHVAMLQAADKAGRFPDLLVERQQAMSQRTGRECSTFRIDILGQSLYFTSDPRNIQAMLATQFHDFGLGPTRRAIMIQTLGDGIFVQDDQPWEHSRALLRPNFVREQVSDLEMEERHVQDLMSVLPVHADGWTDYVDIQTRFLRLTIDAATEFLFGDSVHSQVADQRADASPDTCDEKAFSKHFDSAQMHMASKFRFADMHWLHRPKGFKQNNKVVNDFVQYYVDLALQKGLDEKGVEEGRKEKYVFLDALAQQTRDPVELRAQMLNILLAGRDTTASLLSWVFHELLRHRDVFDRLRATIVAEFGSYDAPHDITFSSLKSCQYLQACLNETLRLWPVVPSNSRRSNKATTLPRGGGPDGLSPVFLPADTTIDYSIHVMHRRKDLWGNDADEFKPDRMIGRRHGWEYLPFNGGPRICIGQQFALTEASYVVVRLLQRFDRIEAVEGELTLPVQSRLTLTNCPFRPVTLRLREARDGV